MSQELATLDVEFFNSIIDNDTEFRNELFVIFKESSSSNLQKMVNSLESDDFSSWYAAAHAFKGAASSIGAFSLAASLEKAQQAIDKSYQEKSSILVEIQQKYSALIAILEEIEGQK
jgi:HPt (histidine-containing phosphotransfer) domain-containing protein